MKVAIAPRRPPDCCGFLAFRGVGKGSSGSVRRLLKPVK